MSANVHLFRSAAAPTSIQFMCRGGDETLSLSLAAACEAARGPMPTPPLWAGNPADGVQ